MIGISLLVVAKKSVWGCQRYSRGTWKERNDSGIHQWLTTTFNSAVFTASVTDATWAANDLHRASSSCVWYVHGTCYVCHVKSNLQMNSNVTWCMSDIWHSVCDMGHDMTVCVTWHVFHRMWHGACATYDTIYATWHVWCDKVCVRWPLWYEVWHGTQHGVCDMRHNMACVVWGSNVWHSGKVDATWVMQWQWHWQTWINRYR